jgi:plasmid stabilization system protein ParE
MPRVIVTPRADRDIAAILDYLTETAGSRVAAKYADAIDEAVARLEDMPGTAAPRPALGPNIRITVVRPYLIIHEHQRGDETLHVLRVVHGRRNITADILK